MKVLLLVKYTTLLRFFARANRFFATSDGFLALGALGLGRDINRRAKTYPGFHLNPPMTQSRTNQRGKNGFAIANHDIIALDPDTNHAMTL